MVLKKTGGYLDLNFQTARPLIDGCKMVERVCSSFPELFRTGVFMWPIPPGFNAPHVDVEFFSYSLNFVIPYSWVLSLGIASLLWRLGECKLIGLLLDTCGYFMYYCLGNLFPDSIISPLRQYNIVSILLCVL